MVRKTPRCFALVCLLALAVLFPTASLQAGESAPAERATTLWSPLEGLWQTIVTAACDHGISIGPGGSCNNPVVQTGCDRGPLIDPNGGCGQ